jgi:hypothetical protein
MQCKLVCNVPPRSLPVSSSLPMLSAGETLPELLALSPCAIWSIFSRQNSEAPVRCVRVAGTTLRACPEQAGARHAPILWPDGSGRSQDESSSSED